MVWMKQVMGPAEKASRLTSISGSLLNQRFQAGNKEAGRKLWGYWRGRRPPYVLKHTYTISSLTLLPLDPPVRILASPKPKRISSALKGPLGVLIAAT